MSRATIRQAVVDWFGNGHVAGLGTLYTAQPRTIPGGDFAITNGAMSGAVATVHIEHELEHRAALGGPYSGEKKIDYTVGLVVMFRSRQASQDDAMGDYDALIEAIKERLRSDRSFGGTVWIAGEEQGGIEINSDLPRLDKQTFTIWSVVRFVVSEWVQA